MDYSRLFIAFSIEKAYTKDIFKTFESLDLPWEKIRIVNSEQIHLTLKFLGETSIEKIPLIIESLDSVNIDAEELILNTSKTEVFNPKNPRTLAISIENNPLIQKLYEEIDKKLFEANIANMEIRKFKPHLTLGRIKKTVDISELDDFLKWQPNKNFVLTNFELIESIATKKGRIFNTLQSFEI